MLKKTPEVLDQAKVAFRHRFVIKRKLQFHFALIATVLIVFSTLTMWFILYGTFATFLANRVEGHTDILSILDNSRMVVVAFILADAAAIFVLFLYLSRYVAGPIYRLEQAMVSLLENN